MITLIAITGLGVLCLLFEIFNWRKAIIPFSILGLIGVLGLIVSEFNTVHGYYNNMIVVDKFAMAFSGLFTLLTIFLIALSHDFYANHPTKLSDFIAIKIFLLAGAVAMVAFGNLSMFFLGIEILSISLYVLAASDRLNLKSNEAGMKYFLMGSFASGFILFGICLIYGATGSFDVAEIYALSQSELIPQWFFIGLGMIIIGMLFKIAAVPFHFWAPDVYEGSPALTTATMSTLAKIVAMAALFKLASGLNADHSPIAEMVIAVVSVLSMTVGNFMALRQDNVKRMLAFSGISHAGFMLMALFSLSSAGILLYYAAAYALAGIAAFAVILYVCKNKGNEAIANFNGLGKTHPILAAILTGALLSMGGIPIFSGFFGKFMLFTQTINSGYLAVVIFAVVNSIVSIGYYFKIILAMYTKESDAEKTTKVPFAFYAVGGVAILLNLAIGIFPSLVVDLLG